jgi:hypothetical protein
MLEFCDRRGTNSRQERLESCEDLGKTFAKGCEEERSQSGSPTTSTVTGIRARSGKSRGMPEAGSLRLTEQSEVGGGRGIRTPGTVSGAVVFKTTAIDHSAIPPRRNPAWIRGFLSRIQGRWAHVSPMCNLSRERRAATAPHCTAAPGGGTLQLCCSADTGRANRSAPS